MCFSIRRHLLVCLSGICMTCGVVGRAKGAPGNEEGRGALLEVARVYSGLRTYRDVTKVTISVRSQEMTQDRTMEFQVALERPNKLSVRLEGGPAATTV